MTNPEIRTTVPDARFSHEQLEAQAARNRETLASVAERMSLANAQNLLQQSPELRTALFRTSMEDRTKITIDQLQARSGQIDTARESLAASLDAYREQHGARGPLPTLLPSIREVMDELRDALREARPGHEKEFNLQSLLHPLFKGEKVRDTLEQFGKKAGIDGATRAVLVSFDQYIRTVYDAIGLASIPDTRPATPHFSTSKNVADLKSTLGFAGAVFFGGAAALTAGLNLLPSNQNKSWLNPAFYGVLTYLCVNGFKFGESNIDRLQEEVRQVVELKSDFSTLVLHSPALAAHPNKVAEMARKAWRQNDRLASLLTRNASKEELKRFFGIDPADATMDALLTRDALRTLQTTTKGKSREAMEFIVGTIEAGGPARIMPVVTAGMASDARRMA